MPSQTQLLANYPNPFNPETWIPFQLSQDAEVRLTIYDVTGKPVRKMQLGHLTDILWYTPIELKLVDQGKLLGIDNPGLEVPFGHTIQRRFPIIPCSYHSFVSPIPIGQLVEESDYVRKLPFDQVHTRSSRWLMKILHGVVVELVNHLIHSENLLLWGSRFFIPYDKRPEIPAHPAFIKLFPLICFAILAPC